MKIRLISILLALTLAVFGMAACGKTEQPADSTTAAPVAEAEEDGQNPVMNFIGNYQSDRRTMLVEAVGMDEAKVSVHWGSDVMTSSEWTMSGKIVEEGENLVLRYTNGEYATVITDENGNQTRQDETSGGTGTVLFKSDYTIVWTDDQDEQIKDLVFEYLPTVEDSEDLDDTDAAASVVGRWSDGEHLIYVFEADGNGSITHQDVGTKMPFTYEADEAAGTILFHEGSADDNTNTTFTMEDGGRLLTLTYESDGRVVELSRIAD